MKLDVPMEKHTTLRVGGPVDAVVSPKTVDQVRRVTALCKAHGVPYWAKGRGSNLLVLSGGVSGVLIDFRDGLSRLERLEGNRVYAESGVNITKFLDFCAREGLQGAEFLTGTPGSVGGAVFMNAGANQGEVKDILEEIGVLNGTGEVVHKRRAEVDFTYRRSGLAPGMIVVSAVFALKPGSAPDIRKTIVRLIKERRSKEPKGRPSAGSIFKNPPGDFAGRLIEFCGLKGASVGAAMVSTEHANFIINKGGAGGDDVLALIRHIRERVKEKTGVLLEPEVQIVGRPGRPDLEGFMEELKRERNTSI